MSLRSHPSVFTLLRRALERYPDRIAFQEGEKICTYREAAGLIASMQSALAASGLGRGARIALLSENLSETWLASIAAQGLGIATSWLHPSGSLSAHVEQLRDLSAAAVVVDASGFPGRLLELAGAMPELALLRVGESTAGVDLMAMCREKASADLAEVATGDDIATLNFTGGTTGRQRGVVKTNAQVGYMVSTMGNELSIPDVPKYLATAYISHVSGQLIAPVLFRGGTVYLSRGFKTQQFCELVRLHGVNMSLMVPTMIYKILGEQDAENVDQALKSLQLVVYAGSVIAPSKLKAAILRFGPIFEQIYAQSECTPIAVLGARDHRLDDLSSLSACGYAVAGTEIKIMGEDFVELPRGEAGEICVRSPLIMECYLDNASATSTALAHGWLHTGDMGVLDDAGRLSIVDRLKDMIVSGGFNVYPKEVEDVIAALPSIASVAVIGVPDPVWGEAVVAVAVRSPGFDVEPEHVISHVRKMKGPLLAPKKVLFVDSLPLTVFGKVDKKALRAPFWSGTARSVG